MASMSSSQNGGLASKEPLSGEKSRQGLGTEVSILSTPRCQRGGPLSGPRPTRIPNFILGQGVADSIEGLRMERLRLGSQVHQAT